MRLPSGDQADRGRPRRAVGQVANVAFFRGHGEDLAVRLEDRARAGGRDVGVQDTLGFQLFEVRPDFGQIARADAR